MQQGLRRAAATAGQLGDQTQNDALSTSEPGPTLNTWANRADDGKSTCNEHSGAERLYDPAGLLDVERRTGGQRRGLLRAPNGSRPKRMDGVALGADGLGVGRRVTVCLVAPLARSANAACGHFATWGFWPRGSSRHAKNGQKTAPYTRAIGGAVGSRAREDFA